MEKRELVFLSCSGKCWVLVISPLPGYITSLLFLDISQEGPSDVLRVPPVSLVSRVQRLCSKKHSNVGYMFVPGK